MGFIDVFLIGIGLAMDAFAVSICRGLGMRVLRLSRMLAVAFCFGVFQALMPVIGYLIGYNFKEYIVSFDHWIAFLLLLFLGGKMIFDVFFDKDEECDCCGEEALRLSQLIIMAVATSIDALAVGVTFAFNRVNILSAASLIGATTFAICFFGVFLGHQCGVKYKKKATLAGGLILVAIGTKILIEHLLGL